MEASNYCKKDDSRKPGTVYYESGPCPTQGQGKRTDIAEAITDINNGMTMKDVAVLHPATFIRMHTGLEKYKRIIAPSRTHHTVSMCIYGASDAGKSHWVRKAYPDALWMAKDANALWWDEYDDHKVVVFDEFNGGVMSLTWFKRLIDKTPLQLAAKGSKRNINPALVIFLSNDPPSEWYSSDLLHGEHKKAFERRLHVIIRVDQLIGLHGAQLPRYRAKCEKMFLPYDMNIGETFRFGTLSCAESAELFDSATSELRRTELKAKVQGQSGGVIMSPPTYLTWESNVSSQLEGFACYAFGCKEYAAGVVPPLNDDMTAPTLTMVPVSRRQVDNPTSHKAPIHPFQTLPAALNTLVTYVPETPPSAAAASIDDSSAGYRILDSAAQKSPLATKKRTPFTLKRTNKRRRCPYIDDEAECSDSDSDDILSELDTDSVDAASSKSSE